MFTQNKKNNGECRRRGWMLDYKVRRGSEDEGLNTEPSIQALTFLAADSSVTADALRLLARVEVLVCSFSSALSGVLAVEES